MLISLLFMIKNKKIYNNNNNFIFRIMYIQTYFLNAL